MSPIQAYLIASRPKTLIASVCPVILGIIPAIQEEQFNLPIFIITLLSALSVQIGCNFTNDYSDFLKGADTASRKGPVRATQAGWISPLGMRYAATLCFVLTALLSLLLIFKGGWVIGFLAFFCIASAYLYTAGPYPLAYIGLGELFVLLFFGLIATSTTYYLQTGIWSSEALLIGIGPGLLSSAILCINNLRDIDEDRRARKKTLAVLFGKQFARIEYLVLIFLASISGLFFSQAHPYCALTTLTLVPAIPLIKYLFSNHEKNMKPLFQKTIQLQIIYTALFILGYLL